MRGTRLIWMYLAGDGLIRGATLFEPNEWSSAAIFVGLMATLIAITAAAVKGFK